MDENTTTTTTTVPNQTPDTTATITNPGIESMVNSLGKPTESDTQNLDVLLQDPKLQAEFDKKLEKAISTAVRKKEQEYSKREAALQASITTEKEKMRENVLEEIEQKRKEAEEMAKMSVEERYKKQIDQQELKIAQYEKELATIRRRDKITSLVAEKGYDPRLLSLLRAEDVSSDEEIEEYVDKRNAVFLEATNARVQTLLKDHPDILLGDKKKKPAEPEFNFNFSSKKG
jgi:metal-dependent amidase/aminoacylase/carboxypeptidase family protein